MLLKVLNLKHKLKKNGYDDIPDISIRALQLYKHKVHGNCEEDDFLAYKKLLRNWIISEENGFNKGTIERRFYGNLTISRCKETNTIFKVFNHFDYGNTYRNRIEPNKELKAKLNDIMGINK